MRERGYDVRRTRYLQRFVYRILRIWDEKIDPKVKEAWKMQLIPIDEAIREIHIRDAKEEGAEKKAFDVARKMLARKMSVSDIVDITGLDEEDILALS